MAKKICFYCKSARVVKNGLKRNKQDFKWKDCGKQFYEKEVIDNENLIREYIDHKQTIEQLSLKYEVCVKTVWNHLSNMSHIDKISNQKEVVRLMDTSYWGRSFGLMIIKDAFRNKVLWYKFVKNEIVADNREGIEWLREHDFKIYGIVCDGMRDIFKEFRLYRVQMCQFHMIMIIRRYLTNNSDLEASKELLSMVKSIARTDEAKFLSLLDLWALDWDSFLKGRSTD